MTMRSTLALPLLFLAACAPAEPDAIDVPLFEGAEEVEATVEPGARRNLLLTVANLRWGETASFTVNGANSGEEVVFTWGSNGIGAGPCPAPLGGLCLDVVSPVKQLGKANADANGVAELDVTLPNGPSGAFMTVQALAIRGVGGVDSVASNAVEQQVTNLVTDSFTHRRGKVDVLFVIDDSCSMSDEQNDLVAAFPAFLDYFDDSGLDYHVGVVSTDMNDPAKSGQLVQDGAYRWIDELTIDPEGTFTNMASLGVTGSANEKGLEAMAKALGQLSEPGEYNEGFRRDDAQLAVIVVSDEDDGSAMAPEAYVDFLTAQTILPQDARLHSLVDLGNCNFTVGQRYLDVSAETAGVEWSICASQYSPLFDAIGDGLASSQPMALSAEPLADIEVVATEPFGAPFVVDPSLYTYDTDLNIIRINAGYRPPVGTEFDVVYEAL